MGRYCYDSCCVWNFCGDGVKWCCCWDCIDVCECW